MSEEHGESNEIHIHVTPDAQTHQISSEAKIEATPKKKKTFIERIRRIFVRSFDVKTQILIRAALVGVLIGIVGVAFRLGTEKLNYFLYHGYYIKQHWYEWLYLPLVCTFGGLLASAMTQKFAPNAAGSGIPQVKYELNNTKDANIKFRTIVTKFFGAMAAIASGLSLGREGPTIQIGAGLASKVSKYLGGKHQKRAVASGAGAGLAAAFNTPIAGVLFVIEELDHDFSSVSLGPAIVGSVAAAVTCRLLYGDYFTFHFQSEGGIDLELMPFYILLGIVAGVVGLYFQKSILFALDVYKTKLKMLPPWSFGAVAGLITGVVGLWLPQAIGGGHITLEGTLAQAYIWWMIPLIFLFKFLLTLVAYGSGVPGGIFAPSLVMGALMGACLGNVTNAIFPELEINPATFAFVGMGAFFTGISRAPITAIVMLFELTGNYNLILPLMFACIIANVTAEKLHEGSIYEDLLKKDGIEINEYKSPSYLQRFKVEEAMIRNVECVDEHYDLKALYQLFENSDHTGFPVLNHKRELVGIVTQEDIHRAFDNDMDKSVSITEIMSTNLKTLYPKDTLQMAILKLYDHKIGRLIVVDPNQTTKILGLITRSDIITFEATHEDRDV